MSIALVPLSSELPDFVELVARAVRARMGARIRGLRVSVDDGCLVVSGRTSTYYYKQMATHAVRDAGFDMTFQNQVEVC